MAEIFFAPFRLLMAAPALAFVPGVLFGVCLWRTRDAPRGRRVALALAAGAWILYGIYELRMQAWSRTVVAPIRVDLLLAAPVLYACTALGAWTCWRVHGRRPGAPSAGA